MKRQELQDATGVLLANRGSGAESGFLDVIQKVPPVNGATGYATSCLYRNPTAVAGQQIFVNVGTNTSALWTPFAEFMTTLTASLTLTSFNSNGLLLLNNASGLTVTLPAATGSGIVFEFAVGTVSTAYVISTNGTDVFKGAVWISLVGTTTTPLEVFSTTTLKNITLNGTTQGGLTIGDSFEVQDIASGVWAVRQALLTGSGVLATPFS